MIRITPTSSNADLRLALADTQERLDLLERAVYGPPIQDLDIPSAPLLQRGWRPYGDGTKFWLDPGNTMRKFPDEIPREILQMNQYQEDNNEHNLFENENGLPLP